MGSILPGYNAERWGRRSIAEQWNEVMLAGAGETPAVPGGLTRDQREELAA